MTEVIKADEQTLVPTRLDTHHVATHAVATSRAGLAPLWSVRYRIALVTLDLCCIIVATIFGYELRFGLLADEAGSLSYLGVGAVIAAAWIVALQSSGGYEIRHLATGPTG